MLVLSRKSQEAIVIRDDIIVRVLEVNRDTVKLGIEAPEDVPVHRTELQQTPDQPRKRKERPKSGSSRGRQSRDR